MYFNTFVQDKRRKEEDPGVTGSIGLASVCQFTSAVRRESYRTPDRPDRGSKGRAKYEHISGPTVFVPVSKPAQAFALSPR